MRTWILTGLLVAATAASGACGRGTDVQKMADGALDSIALDGKVDAHFDRGSKVLRLTGTVDSDREKLQAFEVVTAAIGAYAQVANEVVVRGLQAEAADDLDDGIAERFKTLMKNAPELARGDIDFRIKNGVVTLSGKTTDAAASQRIEDIATSIPGVTQVVNSLAIDAAKAARAGRQ